MPAITAVLASVISETRFWPILESLGGKTHRRITFLIIVILIVVILVFILQRMTASWQEISILR